MSISLLRNLLWSHHETPELQAGERIIRQGRTILRNGLSWRGAHLVLTDLRLIWYESWVPRPLGPISGEISLADIVGVDRGNLFDFFSRGFRVHLRNGRDKVLPLDGGRDDWIAAIRDLIGDTEGSE
jgi:hypothetical protein